METALCDTQVVEVVAGILWRRGQYLAAQRPPHAKHAGFWEFPGGKVKVCESLEQALVRELHEELGVKIENPIYWQCVTHTYPERSVRVHFFHVLTFSGEPQGKEGQSIAWLLPKDGLDMPFLEADEGLVRQLLHSVYTF